jgi:CheY-like chemotaxis protein
LSPLNSLLTRFFECSGEPSESLWGRGKSGGLVVSVSIADEFESTPDSGSTFTAKLEKASSQSSFIEESSGLSQSVTNLEVLCGARILLCEGNEVNQEITRLYLKRLGCHPKIAENGKVGLEYWEENT